MAVAAQFGNEVLVVVVILVPKRNDFVPNTRTSFLSFLSGFIMFSLAQRWHNRKIIRPCRFDPPPLIAEGRDCLLLLLPVLL